MSEDNPPLDPNQPEKDTNIENNQEDIFLSIFDDDTSFALKETPEEVKKERDRLRLSVDRAKVSITNASKKVEQTNKDLAARKKATDGILADMDTEGKKYEVSVRKEFIEDMRASLSALEKDLSDIADKSKATEKYIENTKIVLETLAEKFNGVTLTASAPAVTSPEENIIAQNSYESSPQAILENINVSQDETEDSIRAERDALNTELVVLGQKVSSLRQQYASLQKELNNSQTDADKLISKKKKAVDDQKLLALASILNEIILPLERLDCGNDLISEDQKKSDMTLAAFSDNIEKVMTNLHTVFNKHGISVINPLKQPFDYNKHEAIDTDNVANVSSNIVVKVVTKGYELNGRVVRTAQVTVRV